MGLRKTVWVAALIVCTAFGITLLTGYLQEKGQRKRLREDVVSSGLYREQNIGEEMVSFLRTVKQPGYYVGLYLLESDFGYEKWKTDIRAKDFAELEKRWSKEAAFSEYLNFSHAIWNDVTYFPVPEFTNAKNLTVSYGNTWLSERTYGGERGHEGTDLIAGKNQRGLYPVISMTDGIVKKKGWLEKGGYRIGIQTTAGAYFYYAHLDSYANLNEGDAVKAGDILGFMGDSGYGPEGTVGQFVVHLHLGIYIYPEGKETSINPYWVLRYIENSKVKCYTEK